MVDADPLNIPVRADTDEYHRRMREVERSQDEQERRGRESERRGGFKPALLGGAVGGFVGGAVGGAMGGVFGDVLTALLAPLLIALLPLMIPLINLLLSPTVREGIEKAANVVSRGTETLLGGGDDVSGSDVLSAALVAGAGGAVAGRFFGPPGVAIGTGVGLVGGVAVAGAQAEPRSRADIFGGAGLGAALAVATGIGGIVPLIVGGAAAGAEFDIFSRFMDRGNGNDIWDPDFSPETGTGRRNSTSPNAGSLS